MPIRSSERHMWARRRRSYLQLGQRGQKPRRAQWRQAECVCSQQAVGLWSEEMIQHTTLFCSQRRDMARFSLTFLFLIASELCRGAHGFSSGQDWSSACVGAHCPRRAEAAASASRRQLHPRVQVQQGFQQDAHTTDGGRRTNPRTITAEVFHPGCAGGTCPATVAHRQPGDDGGGAARECRGIGCKLPLRMRHKPKPCVGDGCGSPQGDDGRGTSASPVHVTDRAAQFLDELPDFGSERGAWIQLTCDMKPGE